MKKGKKRDYKMDSRKFFARNNGAHSIKKKCSTRNGTLKKAKV